MGLLSTLEFEIPEVLSTQNLPFMIFSNSLTTSLDFRSTLEDQVNVTYITSRWVWHTFWDINIFQILNHFELYIPDGLYEL